MSGIVIVGAGQAGATLAETLRSKGFDGPVTLVGAEADLPYERPPLSKAYLLGDMARERLYLRPEAIYSEKDIVLKLGQPVSHLDTAAKTVKVGGEVLSYDQLALTTGSVPNRLPAAIGGDLEHVFTVRSLADIDRMRPFFARNARVLVVGGGYIGLEAAAVAAKLGLQVVLVEMAERILGRVAAPETADVIRAAHQAHGVDIREGVGLERLLGEDGVVTGARLTDGSELAVDFVIVGTGIRPDTRLAEEAGIGCDNGIAVDEMGRTSASDVWAAGDCASFPYKGGRLRLESVQNAIDQAQAVAANMLGAGVPYLPYPWFWSDQYDLKLQIAGLNTGYDRIVVRKTDDAVSHWYFRGDTFLAVDAVNAPRDYMVGKRLLEMGRSVAPEVVADPDANLKALLKP
ncbi:NAD(P)/FAD-dependent oxidoreductase [Silicimonas sp. MF1-12-2]|uniref:NAD(P)/FAD-dependent oxidoreductase n=1 Tax=Silicimonas sp. MF1-12-2 TaxID=3384793 RepID=UPI0039B610BD